MMARRAGSYVGLALLAAVLLFGIGAAMFADRWVMWRLRRTTEGSGHRAYELCQRGRAVLPVIYDAFDEHGAEPDVADFRVAVADVLRCVRRGEGSTTNVDNAYRDLPADDALTGRIIRAYVQEPDSERRARMHVFMSELDFRAAFAIHAGFARGPHEVPELYRGLPSVEPYRGEPIADPSDVEKRRVEWCKVIRPLALSLIASKRRARDDYERTEALHELGRAHCSDEDIAVLRAHADDDGMIGLGAVGGLAAMTDSPARAHQTLLPLFSGTDCMRQYRAVTQLEHRLARPIAEAIAAAALTCFARTACDRGEPACRTELVERLVQR